MAEPGPRFRLNTFRAAAPQWPSAAAEVAVFHRALPGHLATPLLRLSGLASELGIGSLLLKNEAERLGLGAFKVLGVSWAVERLARTGSRLGTLSTATAGNYGRALAWVARQRGLPCVVFVPARTIAARVQAIRAEAARVVVVDGSYDDAVDECARRSAVEGWQVVADVGYEDYLEIPDWICEGYGTLFEEVTDSLAATAEAPPDLVVVQGGVGGLAAAAAKAAARWSPRAKVLVVEPGEAACLMASASSRWGEPSVADGRGNTVMAGLNCARASLSAWPVVREGVDAFLAIPDELALGAMRRLAAPLPGDPRVVAGASGAAGVGALLALADPRCDELRRALRIGLGTRILAINTEGATDPAHWTRVVGTAP